MWSGSISIAKIDSVSLNQYHYGSLQFVVAMTFICCTCNYVSDFPLGSTLRALSVLKRRSQFKVFLEFIVNKWTLLYSDICIKYPL
jgi:hypothetical protein